MSSAPPPAATSIQKSAPAQQPVSPLKQTPNKYDEYEPKQKIVEFEEIPVLFDDPSESDIS